MTQNLKWISEEWQFLQDNIIRIDHQYVPFKIINLLRARAHFTIRTTSTKQRFSLIISPVTSVSALRQLW